MSQRLTILMSGMVAGVPHHGGATWAVLQYVLGLRELEHDVFFVEPVSENALTPRGIPFEHSANAAYFRDICREFGLEACAGLQLEGTREVVGVPYQSLVEGARRADLMINIAGMLTDIELIGRIPRRVYLDFDPGFTQLWHETQGIDMRFDGHTHFATVGLAIGQPNCPMPTGARDWITTRQPVVLQHWPAADRIEREAMTTVANWRGYGSIERDGVFYGQKAHAFRSLIELPKHTNERFEIALSIHPDECGDIDGLNGNGWQLLNPTAVASTPARYQRFVQGSRAEIGIAKSGYVHARCGWFSDRSVCYLASGRPVLAQETGFSDFLPTGRGLHAFTTVEDIVDAISALRADYPGQSKAARAIAEEMFDSRLVLTDLIDRIGATS